MVMLEQRVAEPVDPPRQRGIGMIVPLDFGLDRELWRWVPEDVSLHVTRLPGGSAHSLGVAFAAVGPEVRDAAAHGYYTCAGATIGGGGTPTGVHIPHPEGYENSAGPNTVFDSFGTIGGGAYNQVGTTGDGTGMQMYATIGGGYYNRAGGEGATVSGGTSNTALGESASVGGGYSNRAGANVTTIAGGWNNEVHETGGTISGCGRFFKEKSRDIQVIGADPTGSSLKT
mgnify:CR=1 FL=1